MDTVLRMFPVIVHAAENVGHALENLRHAWDNVSHAIDNVWQVHTGSA